MLPAPGPRPEDGPVRIPLLALPVLLALPCTAPGAGEEDPIRNPRLPAAWRVREREEVPASAVAGIAAHLGAPIERLENVVLDAGGIRLQVNLALAHDEAGARALEARFLSLHGEDPAFCARRGRLAAEIVCGNRLAAQRARYTLGFEGPRPAAWSVALAVAPLDSSDDARWNDLFLVLGGIPPGPETIPDPQVAAAARGFTFGKSLRLRDSPPPGFATRFSFAPRPGRRGTAPAETLAAFGDLPRKRGIPIVRVEALVPVLPFSPRPLERGADLEALRAPTPAWPAGDEGIRRAAAAALTGPEGPAKPGTRAGVERILALVRSRVRYGGEEVGSRYGVARVLEQGYGRCWDLSDAFVTFCRASGTPARQVGGWIRGLSGHVWSEALVEGEGWVEVDATTSWTGVSEDYVPLWTSADGRIPLVYFGAPDIGPADPGEARDER